MSDLQDRRSEVSDAAAPASPEIIDVDAPMVSSPQPTTFDKIERSPTGHAMCRHCKLKIKKGCVRVGIKEESNSRDGVVYRKYYHERCFVQSNNNGNNREYCTTATTTSAKRSLKEDIDNALANTDERESRKRKIVFQDRLELRERLRRFRLERSRKLNVQPYRVFHDKTLNECVLHLPSNESEMRQIKGFRGKQMYRKVGLSMLKIIQEYQAEMAVVDRDVATAGADSSSAAVAADAINNDLATEDDEVIVVSGGGADKKCKKTDLKRIVIEIN
mmetsp:Transcript_14940/g.21892  ORF Transcript_14940/g.21892 Transcript_14940/m.21892 type:complete len:275 (-) Transcript_14940:56-880(-)